MLATGLLLAVPDPDDVRPGVLGLLVVLGLVVATVFLLRSFTKQLRKIDFDQDGPQDAPKRAPSDEDRLP